MRVYTVTFSQVAVSEAQDIFEIRPVADHPVYITRIQVGQSSDMGDAQEEGFSIAVIRGHATSGSGGSAATPAPVVPGNAAASFAAEVNNTTIASTGTPVTLLADTFNSRAGLLVALAPEETLGANSGNTSLVVRLLNAPADAITMSGTLFVAEV